MTIGIVAVGSQGDVQPLAALGSGLVRRGHNVRLITHETFRELARYCDLGFSAIPGDPLDIVRGSHGQAWLESAGSTVRFFRHFARIARSTIDELTDQALEHSRGCDALIYGLPLAPIGYTIAEVLDIPAVPTSLYPVRPTSEFPSVLAARLPLRGALVNRVSGTVVVAAFIATIRNLHGSWRRRAGLSPFPNLLRHVERHRIPYLYGYSPSVVPTPHDWGAQHVVCGYWFLPSRDEWKPSKELASFVSTDPPPVYVGFGSMASGDAETVTSAVVEALTRTGQRGVLATGWGGLGGDRLPDGIMQVRNFVPHEWLFPRVSVVVHHGGAGTTATALRVGVPSVVVPFFADQFFWGETVHRLGVGSHPVPRREFTADRFVTALQEVLGDNSVTDRARTIARRIALEDGVTTGADVLDEYLRTVTTPGP
jgi:sterol 3beta-glucosyltransferase